MRVADCRAVNVLESLTLNDTLAEMRVPNSRPVADRVSSRMSISAELPGSVWAFDPDPVPHRSQAYGILWDRDTRPNALPFFSADRGRPALVIRLWKLARTGFAEGAIYKAG